LIRSVKTR